MIFGEEIARMYWSILDNKRIELLRKIVKTISLNNYYMVGGTALSLQLNLRESFDFDFCTSDMFNSDVLLSELKSIGNTEPYNPYTAGRPAICAYPIEIGIDTAIMINPVITSCTKFSLLYFRIVGAKVIFASFILCHSLLSFLLHTLDK